MSAVNVFGVSVPAWIVVPVIFFVWVTVLFLVKKVFFKAIKKVVKKTKTQFDDIFIQSADFPLTLLILASGGAIVERMIPLATDNELTTYFIVGFKAVSVVACVLFFDKFLNSLIQS